jgi:hypothetical protein
MIFRMEQVHGVYLRPRDWEAKGVADSIAVRGVPGLPRLGQPARERSVV